MDPFEYEEEILFRDFGLPALVYEQCGRSPEGTPLHIETGIWRADDAGVMAVTIALPRVTEVSEGSIADGRIELSSTSVRRAAGGAELVRVRRSYRMSGDKISYEVAMATEEVPEVTLHLRGTLARVAVAARERVRGSFPP